jgi:hypothetical protein
MLTPHSFFTRFREVAGHDAQAFFQRLPPEEIDWLINDEAWPLLEHWIARVRQDGFEGEPIQHDMSIPELICRECTDYTKPEDTAPYCMNRQKPIPDRILKTGCNDWRPA